jgi:hypothetical protein
MRTTWSVFGVFSISLLLTSGCSQTPTRPETGTPSAQALMEGAPTRSPQSGNFELLWNASADAARELHFVIDRQDRRGGIMTSLPMTNAQWFEPWRQDNQTAEDVAVSSLSTLRRTVRMEFVQASKDASSTWVVMPKVLVERQSRVEERVTSSAQYRSVLKSTLAAPLTVNRADPDGPGVYWYPVSRDAALERELAKRIESRLR